MKEQNSFRAKRFKLFCRMMGIRVDAPEPVRILDLGGSFKYWQAFGDGLDGSMVDITIVNLDQQPVSEGFIRVEQGDARHLDRFADNAFDVVHSNSVIEHVGHWADMKLMASEVRRLAPRYFIQTPNYWFPIEPHYCRLGYQYLPEDWRARLLLSSGRGFLKKAETYDEALNVVQHQNLLTYRQVQELFPDAEIIRERFVGLTKSFMAVRR